MRYENKIKAGLAAVALVAGGCTNTQTSMHLAGQLAVDLKKYQVAQKGRVDQFNVDYRDRFSTLMDDLVTLEDKQADQMRDKEAQVLADALTKDDGESLIGKLRSDFATNLTADRQAVADADTAVTSARAAYVKAYKDASLDLSKLDAAEKDLETLATRGSSGDVLPNSAAIIRNIANNYDEFRKQAGATSTASTAKK